LLRIGVGRIDEGSREAPPISLLPLVRYAGSHFFPLSLELGGTDRNVQTGR